jgi:hypothetical protein
MVVYVTFLMTFLRNIFTSIVTKLYKYKWHILHPNIL